jgi:hypothetical protein
VLPGNGEDVGLRPSPARAYLIAMYLPHHPFEAYFMVPMTQDDVEA